MNGDIQTAVDTGIYKVTQADFVCADNVDSSTT